MNTPTRQAPHICDQVLAKIAPICARLTRSTSTVMIHDAKMAVPPTNGVQLNTALMVAPGVNAGGCRALRNDHHKARSCHRNQ